MVKFYDFCFNYDYPFSAVSLAYFLRYPNPKARHVLSTDVIDRHFDPETQQLSTTRLHLKRSKIPPAVLRLLPKGILGKGGNSGNSYVLEKTVINIRNGWMETESRNLEWTGILSVVERQTYLRPASSRDLHATGSNSWAESTRDEGTEVSTSVTLLSRFGQARALRKRGESGAANPVPASSDTEEEEAPAKRGFFASLSASGLQRTIEMVGLRRTREALRNGKEGMNIVLERMRGGGLRRVLEGMQQDRLLPFAPGESET